MNEFDWRSAAAFLAIVALAFFAGYLIGTP